MSVFVKNAFNATFAKSGHTVVAACFRDLYPSVNSAPILDFRCICMSVRPLFATFFVFSFGLLLHRGRQSKMGYVCMSCFPSEDVINFRHVIQ